MTIYEVTSEGAELPYGARFTVKLSPIKQGTLCLFSVGTHLIIGRWIEGWIVQPDRWIHVSAVVVKCLGQAILLFAI